MCRARVVLDIGCTVARAVLPRARPCSPGRLQCLSGGSLGLCWAGATCSSQWCFPFLLQAQQGSLGPGVASETAVQTASPGVKTSEKPATVPSPPPAAVVTQATEGQDGPPSPLSEASSGYFSHSVSTATLSDALGLGLDAAVPAGQTPGSPPAPSQAAPEAGLAFSSCAQSHQPGCEEPAAQPPPPAPSRDPEASRALSLHDPPLSISASPFRIQKVRTSELKSFTRMLGSGSGIEEDLLAPGGSGDTGGQALGMSEVASDSEETSEVPEWLKEGEYIAVGTNKTGIVRYVGPVDFQEGTWVGVELDLPSGEWSLEVARAGREAAPCAVAPQGCWAPTAHPS